MVVGHPHLPVINPAAYQRGPAVLHLDRRVRRLLSALPDQLPLSEFHFRRGDADFVARLQHAPFRAHQFPAQPRLSHIDPHRIHFVLAAQVPYRERSIAESVGCAHRHDCSGPRRGFELALHCVPPEASVYRFGDARFLGAFWEITGARKSKILLPHWTGREKVCRTAGKADWAAPLQGKTGFVKQGTPARRCR